MRLLIAQAKNFGSYKSIMFDFESLGLSLISGPTGSGKSTLQDLVTWILFGCTAKGGTVDEVRSWNSKSSTEGTLLIRHANKETLVTRVRGKSSENDLYWTDLSNNKVTRGKNILETQSLLNTYLSIDEDLFIAGSYFHEFSLTSNFFNAKTKDKRALFEKLAFLELPVLLEERAKQTGKTLKEDILKRDNYIESAKVKVQHAKLSLEEAKQSNDTWNEDQKIRLLQLEKDYAKWIIKSQEIIVKAEDRIKELNSEIEAVNMNACPTCGVNGAEKTLNIYRQSLRDQQKLINSNNINLNPFTDYIQKEKSTQNYYPEIITKHESILEYTENQLATAQHTKETLTNKLNLITQILDISYRLRSKLLEDTVRSIQTRANSYLEKYFDGEIRVGFSCKDSDTLEVTIEKNGYNCEYTQLSKGQRGILKLCFGISVMNCIAERSGVHFNTLFFDEALDGLDADMKIKAFGLFKSLELEHESILVIDHEPGFQNMFDTQFKVTLEADCSKIDKV